MSGTPPIIQTMLLCEEVDCRSNSLLRIVSGMSIKALPAAVAPAELFIEYTDGSGTVDLDIQFVIEDDPAHVVGSKKWPLTIENPLSICQEIMPFGNMIVTRAVPHELRILYGRRVLFRRRFPVRLVSELPKRR